VAGTVESLTVFLPAAAAAAAFKETSRALQH
jgi:hypothetical protein